MEDTGKIKPIRPSVSNGNAPTFLMNPRQLRDPAEGGRETVEEALSRLSGPPADLTPGTDVSPAGDKKAA